VITRIPGNVSVDKVKENIKMQISLGIDARTYNWIMDFLFDRKIQIRVGKEYKYIQQRTELLKAVCVVNTIQHYDR